MKKRIIAWLLCGMMVLGLASCGSSMSYEDYDLKDYLKVGEYKGLTVAPYSVTVTDEDVDAQIQSNLDAAASWIRIQLSKMEIRSTSIIPGK